MSTCCHLPLNFNRLFFHKPDNRFSSFSLSKPYPHSLSTTPVRSSLSPSGHEREEGRWLREEQRWLREERRWLREESRWHSEREALIGEISALKLRIEELERQGGGSVPKDATLLPLLNRIAEVGSAEVAPLVLEVTATAGEGDEVEVVKEVVGEVKKREVKKRETLRKGSEGDEVRAMQEALQKLGFYCGEEDLEFSSFDSGTERAVKTWQASLGAPEDGIMTAELQARLYTERQVEYSGVILKEDPKGTAVPKGGANGAAVPVTSVTEISEIQHKIVEDKGNAEIEVSQHRVFLLGENRWEEPSRLVGRKKADGGAKSKVSMTKCLSCRGEGRLLCTECDGSGEPNIEPQFLEWVDEGMKCPYCEGQGFTTCDVCDGKGQAVV